MMNELMKISPNELTRNWLGVDRLFDNFWSRDHLDTNYPRHNIVRTAGGYRLELALPGWNKSDVKVRRVDGGIVVEGTMEETIAPSDYIHKGLSTKSFVRKFALSNHVEVARCELKDGMLYIELAKEPEDSSEKLIEIQ